MINSLIGKYRIIRLLGKGGMASVYEAEHALLSTRVAVKVLNPILSADFQIRERFINEAKLMASLNHPNITRVIDFDEQPQQLSIIMEFLDGEDMNEKINRTGPLAKKEILSVFSQTLTAFQYAHEKGIVHRDIKPSNIFILPNGQVKILDFGIAKLFGMGNDMTQTGTQIGTPVYMSPEQVRSDKSIDHRSDIYSLGVTLFFACTGRPPYEPESESKFDIFNKIVYEPVPLYFVEDFFKPLISKACEKNREDRFQSCEEWLNNLHNGSGYDKGIQNNNQSFYENNQINTQQIESNHHQNNIILDDPRPSRKKEIFFGTIVFFMLVISGTIYLSTYTQSNEPANAEFNDSSTLNKTADNTKIKNDDNSYETSSNKEEMESKKREDEIAEKDNLNTLYENIDTYRNIMNSYYFDLSNDNYEKLTSYYADVLTGYLDNNPVSKYDLVENHRRYHDNFPYHNYSLIDITPYKAENNTVSYYVKLNASVSKTYNSSQRANMVKDIYTFDKNKKIVNVKIIK